MLGLPEHHFRENRLPDTPPCSGRMCAAADIPSVVQVPMMRLGKNRGFSQIQVGDAHEDSFAFIF